MTALFMRVTVQHLLFEVRGYVAFFPILSNSTLVGKARMDLASCDAREVRQRWCHDASCRFCESRNTPNSLDKFCLKDNYFCIQTVVRTFSEILRTFTYNMSLQNARLRFNATSHGADAAGGFQCPGVGRSQTQWACQNLWKVTFQAPKPWCFFFSTFFVFPLLLKVDSCLRPSRSWCGSILHWSHPYLSDQFCRFVCEGCPNATVCCKIRR